MQTFKVGDFVTIDGSTYLVHIEYNGDHYISEDVVNLFSKNNMSIKPWQPLPGELVILKDKHGIISVIKYNGEPNVYPFIGEITWLHKKD